MKVLRAWWFIYMPYAILGVVLAGAPFFAHAHEVYVLDAHNVAADVATSSPNPFSMVAADPSRFVFWGGVAVLLVITVFFMSVWHRAEHFSMPLLRRLKRLAPLAARLTLGVCLMACAYYQGLFGPELSFADFAGGYAPLLTGLLYALGTLIVFGYRTRLAALVALCIFVLAAARYGTYMFTYANYLGEMLIMAILGGHSYGIHTRRHDTATHIFQRLARALEPYAFLIARVCFGVAIIFAAVYAKLLHAQLALDVVRDYNLTAFFPFDPLFVVLGAFIVETLIGLFFILGIEVRWNSLFFLFWLALSLVYFGEVVWPHLILIGLNVTLLFHGYDRYTVEGRLFARRGLEPVL